MSKSELCTCESSRKADGQALWTYSSPLTRRRLTQLLEIQHGHIWHWHERLGATLRLDSPLSQGIPRRKEKLKAAGDSFSSSYLLNSDGAKQQLMGTQSTPHKNKAFGPPETSGKGRCPTEEERGRMSFHASRHSLGTGDAAVPTLSPIILKKWPLPSKSSDLLEIASGESCCCS